MTTIDTPLGAVQGPLSCESQLGETPYQRRCRQLREVFADSPSNRPIARRDRPA